VAFIPHGYGSNGFNLTDGTDYAILYLTRPAPLRTRVRAGFLFMGTSSIGPHIYKKPYRTVSDQLALLQGRGMEITDLVAASACLQRIGYYRLSGYWYPFRKSHLSVNPLTRQPLLHPATRKPQVVVEDEFRPGTTFQRVMELYVFDKRLRLLFLDAIERVEVALRVDIALLIGARDPWAHRDPGQLHPRFQKIDVRSGKREHEKWLEKLDKSFDRSRDEFVKHFKLKYAGDQPPIWIAIEMWEFGMLSVFLSGMKNVDQVQLAQKYGLPRAELLSTWARNINNVRNICAHHSRLWNRSPADQISPPKIGELPDTDHLATDLNARSRIYATAATLQFLLRTIHPTSSWSQRLKDHFASFPVSPDIALSQGGFPRDWEALALWN
jgi:abortive infection bacteriophage resistance protein